MKEIISKPICFKATCDLCGTIFTYQKEDCERHPFEKTVKCPTCDNELTHGDFRAVYKEELQLKINELEYQKYSREFFDNEILPNLGIISPYKKEK